MHGCVIAVAIGVGLQGAVREDFVIFLARKMLQRPRQAKNATGEEVARVVSMQERARRRRSYLADMHQLHEHSDNNLLSNQRLATEGVSSGGLQV